MPSIGRGTIDALLPDGSLWRPAPDGDLDNALDGLSDGLQYTIDDASELSRLRNPLQTPVLSDLEREYGILPDDRLTDAERRQRLLAAKTATDGDGSAPWLQDRLQAAGFDVLVHINNPPVDPATFIFDAYPIVSGNSNAICGRANVVCGGGVNGELVVNGVVVQHEITYSIRCATAYAVCGQERALCGAIDAIVDTPIAYAVPADPGYWGLFFFVGGEATRNEDGELVSIALAEIPLIRREEFRSLIVRHKPAHSWGGLVIEYV